MQLKLIPHDQFEAVRQSSIDWGHKLGLLADMCRANALVSVKRAGSGHLGSSLSSLDIVTFLYYREMNVADLGLKHHDRDIYFSSKGHDVPGLYSVLYALGFLPKRRFLNLRRLGGTHGHPDVSIPGIEANSGSLGMGISKAKGMAIAKHLLQRGGRIFVMTGDGELQEGQIYEALQSAVTHGITDLHVIVDHNKVQSDKPVKEIVDLGDLEAKFQAFGWHVKRCDGHDFRKLDEVFQEFRSITDKPKVLIADTIKGRGISFMEHPNALKEGGGLYRWHSGAPDDRSFAAGYEEIAVRIGQRCDVLGIPSPALEVIPPEDKMPSRVSTEYVSEAFGKALVEIAERRQDLVVLDADLAADCRIRLFEEKFPRRFVESGIAEQDMVSVAGGLALQGMLPVVNTFAAFLAARANEQIYNNACEGSKIIYVSHYAGLIPAGPGASHQSIRDISLLAALPNFTILQPCNAKEAAMAVDYCVESAPASCVLRLNIGPSPRALILPESYRLTLGQGVSLTEGSGAVIFAYGPVMLHEALLAAEVLQERGFGLEVVNMPWLNNVDVQWLAGAIERHSSVCVLDDHATVGGLGDHLASQMVQSNLLGTRKFEKFAVEGYPACGTPQQVMSFHGLDGRSLAERIWKDQ